MYKKHHNKYLISQVKHNIWLEIAKKLAYNEGVDLLINVLYWYGKRIATTAKSSIKSRVQRELIRHYSCNVN